MTETLAHGYSSESNQRELSNEYQHDMVWMVFKNLCILVLWTYVASALEGLSSIFPLPASIPFSLLLPLFLYWSLFFLSLFPSSPPFPLLISFLSLPFPFSLLLSLFLYWSLFFLSLFIILLIQFISSSFSPSSSSPSSSLSSILLLLLPLLSSLHR